MRIALLGKPEQELFGRLQEMASQADAGFEIVEVPAGSAADVAQFLAACGSVDLIHTMAGAPSIEFVRSSGRPLLCTIDGEPTEADLEILRRYNSDCAYVSQGIPETTDLDDLELEAVLPDSSPTSAERYKDLYQGILDRMKHEEDHRPWGFFEVLSDRADHKVKRITVYPGKRLSLQRHQRREEHWFFIQGEAVVTLGDQEIPLREGQSIEIPLRAIHRVANPGTVNAVFIEVQRGDYFGEDDIERLEDDFGRAGTTA